MSAHTGQSSRYGSRFAVTPAEVGWDGQPKGVVRVDADGNLEWAAQPGAWLPAVYHESIRPRLLLEASLKGEYDHPRARGELEGDVTSFHEDHRHWGPNRENWPPILHRFNKSDNVDDKHLARKPGFWFRKGRVVLDDDNHPIKAYSNLPSTLSSQLEGWFMEAVRCQNPKIEFKDFRARMTGHLSDPVLFLGSDLAKPQVTLSELQVRSRQFREERISLGQIGRRTPTDCDKGSKTPEATLGMGDIFDFDAYEAA